MISVLLIRYDGHLQLEIVRVLELAAESWLLILCGCRLRLDELVLLDYWSHCCSWQCDGEKGYRLAGDQVNGRG